MQRPRSKEILITFHKKVTGKSRWDGVRTGERVRDEAGDVVRPYIVLALHIFVRDFYIIQVAVEKPLRILKLGAERWSTKI